MEVLPCANPSVLAYVRSGDVADILSDARLPTGAVGPPVARRRARLGSRPVLARTVPAGNESEDDEVVHRHQAVLCVHNLSRFAQPAELALAKWAGSTPYEVLGRVPFPVITEEPYTITLPPYGFLWFDLVPEDRLRRAVSDRARREALRSLAEAWLGLHGIVAPDGWRSCGTECCARDAPGCSTWWPGSTAGWPTSWSGCAAWPTSPTSCARARSARSACWTTRRGWPSAPTRCATPSWPRCCWPPSARSRRGPGPVGVVRDDEDAVVLDCGDRGDLMVFPWLDDGPGPTST